MRTTSVCLEGSQFTSATKMTSVQTFSNRLFQRLLDSIDGIVAQPQIVLWTAGVHLIFKYFWDAVEKEKIHVKYSQFYE
jgi:hypothetical protein